MELVKHNEIEEKTIILHDVPVILDSDVATIYEVETKRINEAISNNSDKFPQEYIINLTSEERKNLKLEFSSSSWSEKNKLPKALTEKGLYMLATILKGNKAEKTTIEIIDTFAKFRELRRTVIQIAKESDQEKQKSSLRKNGEIIADIIKDDLEITDTKISLKINVAIAFKFKRTA